MKKIILLTLLCTMPLCAQQFGQVGTSGAQLFKINFDPRASALGYAAASVVNNAAALYTNVAGLESIAKADVAFSYTPWFADITMGSFVAAYRIQDIGVVGFQVCGFSTDEEITTVDQENGTGVRYNIQNTVVGLSFTRRIMDKLAIGIQGKYIRESYYDHTTSGIAFDIGSNYDLGMMGSRLALTLQNFGPDLDALQGTFRDYSDSNLEKGLNGAPLPVTFRASFTMEPIIEESYRVRFIADLVHPNDNIEHYNIGCEALLLDFLALRGGVKLNYDDESFALGIGVNGGQFLGQNLRFDYSYEKFTILPSIQKFSVGFSF
ncbi:MAG: PorV/PorQ family protein [bacterium]